MATKKYILDKNKRYVPEKEIKKSMTKVFDKAYKAGALEALSKAVNIYNVPEYIREGVLKKMKIN